MIRKITFLITLLCCVQIGYSQSVNLTDASISPAPLPSVQANGSGEASFRLQETSGSPVSSPVFGGQPNVTITVDLGEWIALLNGVTSLSTITIVDEVSGDDRSSIFTTSYDEKSHILIFEQTGEDIPDDANILFTFPIKVIQNSSQAEANNGFNANINALGSDTNAQGNAAFFTWTTNTTTAVNDILNTNMNTIASGSVLTNDTDFEGDTQSVTTITVFTDQGVTVNIDSTTGNYTYTPPSDYTGEDSFEYTVCDNGSPQACDTAKVFIEVIPDGSPDNEKPIANADTNTTEQDTDIKGNVLSNDFDRDGDTLTVSTTTVTSDQGAVVNIDTNTGAYTYTPPAGFVGEDSFEYIVCDDGTPQACDSATVVISVVEDNTNITVANDDAVNTTPDTALSGNVLINDSDPEEHVQTVTTTSVATVQGVTVTIDANTGIFNYTPPPGFTGQDSFEYTICDNGTPQACDSATVSITVGGIANTTDAVNDILNTNMNTIASGSVLTNDTDFDDLIVNY